MTTSTSSFAPVSSSPLRSRFLAATQFLVFYTILVIIWGAWVRISHSGDGCGSHWPLCDGALIPTETDQKTWVEYTHRLSSGLYGIFVTILFVLSYKAFCPQSAGRKVALATFVLMMIEALLGAALVLKGLVGENATIFRLVVMTFHQINSLLLVGSTVILSLVASPEMELKLPLFSWKKLFQSAPSLVTFILIPATGAWAALANTLFPSQSLSEGLLKDFQSDSPWILRLRLAHPALALLIGFAFIYYFFQESEKTEGDISKASLHVAAVLAIGLLFGILTLLFLSPVWMKLVHLTIAQVIWVFLVRYAMISLLSTSR